MMVTLEKWLKLHKKDEENEPLLEMNGWDVPEMPKALWKKKSVTDNPKNLSFKLRK